MHQFYNARQISILSNKDGWTDDDLKTLKEIIEEKFEVKKAERNLLLKTDYNTIPTLMLILGLWFHPFFQAFFSELGRDIYHKLKDFIVKKLKDFQNNFDSSSLKIEFVGKYEEIDVRVSIDARDEGVVNEAFEKINEVLPFITKLIDDFIKEGKKVERIWVIYSARRKKWELNFANFADGSQEFGELYYHKDSLEYV